MFEITKIDAIEVLDSRGRPTVEASVVCDGQFEGRASVPSGASTGKSEAHELRDGGARLRGYGVRQAVELIRTEIDAALAGCDAREQQGIDWRLRELDGTPDKSRLGANALLAVSLATVRAAAAALKQPVVAYLADLWERTIPATVVRTRHGLFKPNSLPMPMVNMISGGAHAGGNLDLQDFLLIPVGAMSYSHALDQIVETYFELGPLLQSRGYEGVLVGDEGGYGPRLKSNEEAIELVIAAAERAGLRPGRDFMLALDVASTQFYRDGRYHLRNDPASPRTAGSMVDLLSGWVRQYPILSIEDGLAEDDWESWSDLTAALGSQVQLLGDDLFTTNCRRLQQGIDRGVANSILIKVNQIGSLSETFDALIMAWQNGYTPVISARSGETEDPFIADLATATGAGQIKIGSVVRSERLAKYNQLLRLERMLGGHGRFSGSAAFAGRTALARWQSPGV